jgi:hypothetical protein
MVEVQSLRVGCAHPSVGYVLIRVLLDSTGTSLPQPTITQRGSTQRFLAVATAIRVQELGPGRVGGLGRWSALLAIDAETGGQRESEHACARDT